MLQEVSNEIIGRLEKWEAKYFSLSDSQVSIYQNKQNRNIKQILGHMIDSASNNTHRIIHLQYQTSPISFPDYANLGNNDRWIAIQNYGNEDWDNLVNLWKYAHLHLSHVINNMDETKVDNVWVSALNEEVTLGEMIVDFPKHMQLHLGQIDELILESKK